MSFIITIFTSRYPNPYCSALPTTEALALFLPCMCERMLNFKIAKMHPYVYPTRHVLNVCTGVRVKAYGIFFNLTAYSSGSFHCHSICEMKF